MGPFPIVLLTPFLSCFGGGERCVGLDLKVDGRVIEPVRLELSVAGQTVQAASCPGGFKIPRAVQGHEMVGVRVKAPGYDLDFGDVSVRKLDAASWDVRVDTRPFEPVRWRRPFEPVGDRSRVKPIKEIWEIGFVSGEGDGTVLAVYIHDDQVATPGLTRLGDLLLRVDAIEEGRWLCLPGAGGWSLDSPATTVPSAGEPVDTSSSRPLRCNGAEELTGVLPTGALLEVAERLLSERPEADAAMLFDALMRAYCEREDALESRCRGYKPQP